MCDPAFRAALAAAGFTLDPATGEIAELSPYVGALSERAAQISRNIDRYEAEWRAANPGQEPGPAVRRSWDRRAWKDARPDKIIPTDGASPGRRLAAAAARPRLPSTPPNPACRSSSAPRRWVPSTATPPSRPSSPGSVHGGRRGIPPTSAARSRSGSRPPVSSPTPRSGASWLRISPPAPSRRVSRCSTGRTCPEHVRSLTSAACPRRRGRHRDRIGVPSRRTGTRRPCPRWRVWTTPNGQRSRSLPVRPS